MSQHGGHAKPDSKSSRQNPAAPNAHQQTAIGLFVIHHPDAPTLPGIASSHPTHLGWGRTALTQLG